MEKSTKIGESEAEQSHPQRSPPKRKHLRKIDSVCSRSVPLVLHPSGRTYEK